VGGWLGRTSLLFGSARRRQGWVEKGHYPYRLKPPGVSQEGRGTRAIVTDGPCGHVGPLPRLAFVRTGGRVTILGAVSLVAACLSGPVTAAHASSPADYGAIDAHVRATLEAWAVPGGAIGIVQGGHVLHLAAFGRSTADGRAMTTATPVVIGSVGKSITALAIRQLIEAGRLDASAPVTRYLPWLELGNPAARTGQITIRSLLEHTSGFSTADGQDPARYAPGLTPADVVRSLASVRLDRPVGTYEYSNLNYVLLGVIIEEVSGQRYGDYLRDHVFGPLAMTRSFTATDSVPDAADLATGHRYLFGMPVPFSEPYPSGMVAAGYQISSVEDMARFVAALANGGYHEGADVVAAKAVAGDRAYSTDWQPLPFADPGLMIGQSGATLGTNADILELPAEHLAVVVLMNANPIQLNGLPGGAAEIAVDVMRLTRGLEPGSAPPSVRTVYLAVDAIILVLAGLLVVHGARARSWSKRLARARNRKLFLARTFVADLLLPLAVLVGVPLAIGMTGSSAAGDIVAGWRFMLWTLPDLGVALLALSIAPVTLGAVKVALWRADPHPGQEVYRGGHASASPRSPNSARSISSSKRT
jgi:CubicO group peptidase (beta-lactamase class C family)